MTSGRTAAMPIGDYLLLQVHEDGVLVQDGDSEIIVEWEEIREFIEGLELLEDEQNSEEEDGG